MKIKSSNKHIVNMKPTIDILEKINHVEVRETLYDAILQRIKENKNANISLAWVTSIAATLLIVISIEAISVVQKMKQSTNSSHINLLPKDKFDLYE